jgi:hypothetical protein
MGRANDPIDWKYGISDEQRARRNGPSNPWDTVKGIAIFILIIIVFIKSCSE